MSSSLGINTNHFKMLAVAGNLGKNGLIIAASRYGYAYAALNDLTQTGWSWTDVYPSASYSTHVWFNCVMFDGTRFILAGQSGGMAYTSDGATFVADTNFWQTGSWTRERGTANSVSERIFDSPSGFIDCMLFAKGRFIALSGMDGAPSKSAYSTDGVHRTQGGDPGLGNSTDSPRMAYGGGYIVAVDNLGRASYSTDVITRTQTETGFGWTPIKDVAYGSGINGAGTGRFVIVGGEGKAAYCDIEILDE